MQYNIEKPEIEDDEDEEDDNDYSFGNKKKTIEEEDAIASRLINFHCHLYDYLNKDIFWDTL